MRIISFNVNGIRSMTGKIKSGEKTGSAENNCIKTLIQEQKPDILCFQEVKTQNAADLECYKTDFKYIYTNFSKIKKGYSGVSLMTNVKPQWISYDFNMYCEDHVGPYNTFDFINEGRLITAKFENLVVITAYVPNSKEKLARLSERIEWETIMRNYLTALKTEYTCPVVLCGDLNVAATEKDIHNPKGQTKMPGFSIEERTEFQKMLDCEFTDSFRHLHPNEVKYSYWSNFGKARENNKGWRIDYCLVSSTAKDIIVEADCLNGFRGSDHCPVMVILNM